MGHPDAQPCDREALVRPMLGLFYEIYRDRHGSRKKAWEVLEPRLKKLYPKDFDWVYFTAEGETLVERAPLFGDLIDATRAVVDLEERGGGRNLDSSKGGTELPLLAGSCVEIKNLRRGCRMLVENGLSEDCTRRTVDFHTGGVRAGHERDAPPRDPEEGQV